MSAQSNVQQFATISSYSSQHQQENSNKNQRGRNSKNSGNNNRKPYKRNLNENKQYNNSQGYSNRAYSNNLQNNSKINSQYNYYHNLCQNNNFVPDFNINNYINPNNFQNGGNKFQNRRNIKNGNFGIHAPINSFKLNQNYGKQKHKGFIDLQKTKMCSNFTSGNCLKGDQCSFAHSESELKQKPDLNKTKLCEEFEKNGKCTLENCCFAHGVHDLRYTDDFYKTSLCFNFTKEGRCENADKCRYAHGESELKNRNFFEQKASKKNVYNNGKKNKFEIMMSNQSINQQVKFFLIINKNYFLKINKFIYKKKQQLQFLLLQNFFQNMLYQNDDNMKVNINNINNMN